MPQGPSRPYELRLPPVADPRIRGALLTALGHWAPTPADPGRADRLGRSGLVLRLSLKDTEAAALLRGLYASGVAPASVVLRPIDAGLSRPGGSEDPSFSLFARRGGRFVPTWNWRAFVFGPLWYLRRGLYGKGLVLLGLSVCPFFTLAFTILLGAAVLVYCGVAGNWDDYLWRVKGTQWW